MRKTMSTVLAVSLLFSLFAFTPVALGTTTDGWKKIAQGGIDDPSNYFAFPSVEFKGKLYSWVPSTGNPAPVWAYDGTSFTHAAPNGFGDPGNDGITGGLVFQGYLYMGTENYSTGGQVYRTANGTEWQRVGDEILPEDGTAACHLLGEQDGKLIIGISRWEAPGGIAYAFDGTDPMSPAAFTLAGVPGYGLSVPDVQRCIAVIPGGTFAGRLQVCAEIRSADSDDLGFQPIEYAGGANWVPTAPINFGEENIQHVYRMAMVGGTTYAGTQNDAAGQLWKRGSGGWTRVATPFIDPSDANALFPAAIGDRLGISTTNFEDHSPAGPARFYLEGTDGGFSLFIDRFDDPANLVILATVFKGRYVAFAANPAGFQVWEMAVKHSITVTQGPHGTITPAGIDEVVSVDEGADQKFTIKPDSGYEIADVKVDGASVGARTSYTFKNVTKDHSITAVFASVKKVYYLAEGTNAWGFTTYVSLANPNKTAVTATVSYLETGAPSGKEKGMSREVIVPANSQTTVSSLYDIGPADFSTEVESALPLAVDRTMYWTGESSSSPGYHSSVATDSPARKWYLAEGSSRWGFETWTAVLNPNDAEASVTLTYMTEDAGSRTRVKKIPARSRVTCSMKDDAGETDASIQVSSDLPVVAERSMYRNDRREGSCSVGASVPSRAFFLSEGATGYGPGFTTWVLVQNPGDVENEVRLTFQTPAGSVPGPSLTMGPNSRKSVKINDTVAPDTDVSTVVEGSAPLVAERAMYWNSPAGEAFHASVGMSAPARVFFMADGQTWGGCETWVLVQNPNDKPVEVEVAYLLARGGAPVSITETIGANSRKSFNMADSMTGRAGIRVTSVKGGPPVMVERAMYWNDKSAGACTTGACTR